MGIIVGIDPGPEESAVAMLDGTIIVARYESTNALLASTLPGMDATTIAIEDFVGYGKSLSWESFETIKWIGVFRWLAGKRCLELGRPDIKLHLCGIKNAKDTDVMDALCRRWGPGRKAAVGTKKAKGPLYGFKGHLWAALAVAVTATETPDSPGPSP